MNTYEMHPTMPIMKRYDLGTVEPMLVTREYEDVVPSFSFSITTTSREPRGFLVPDVELWEDDFILSSLLGLILFQSALNPSRLQASTTI